MSEHIVLKDFLAEAAEAVKALEQHEAQQAAAAAAHGIQITLDSVALLYDAIKDRLNDDGMVQVSDHNGESQMVVMLPQVAVALMEGKPIPTLGGLLAELAAKSAPPSNMRRIRQAKRDEVTGVWRVEEYFEPA